MSKHAIFEKFVLAASITIPRFTGHEKSELDFLDQPDAWDSAPESEVTEAKQQAIEISRRISVEQTKGRKLAGMVATIARKQGDQDAAYIADIIAGYREYVVADLLEQD